jgi:ABC-type Fe3+/spermidine/putrescine transport system ATPase subunit
MEAELRRVHRETGATWVYVTHDQREALALSDRIAVFEQGRIDQLADPLTIYRAPATPFAAGFVGNANVLACEVKGKGKSCVARLAGSEAPVADAGLTGAAWLVLRPESIQVESGGDGVTASVRDVAFRGTGFSYRLEVDGLDELIKAEVAAGPEHPIELGTEVTVVWPAEAAIILPREP